MKKFVFALIMSALLFTGLVPANAASHEAPTTKTLRITKYGKNVNKPCPRGSDKMFILKVFVRKNSLGTFAEGNRGVAEIVLRNDRQLNAEDYQVPPEYRVSEFFFFAPSRKSRVKKDPAENSVTVQLAGPNMRLRVGALRAQCQERFGG